MKLSEINSLYTTKVDREIIDRMISIINTGRAILFTGAGFSVGCENILGEEPPRAKKLANLICQKGEFEEDDDLAYVSDFFLRYGKKHELLGAFPFSGLCSQ